MIDKAIEFAVRAHEGQYRKGSMRPYVLHPIEVADIVSAMTDDVEVISAAYLHDTIEDCPGVTRELLAEEFSPRVAWMVAQESEDKTKTWFERKNHTVCHIKDADQDVQRIALADKLSNMRDIDRDYPAAGEKFWNRFRMKDKDKIAWYYRGVRNALKDAFDGEPVYEEYCRLIKKNFGE